MVVLVTACAGSTSIADQLTTMGPVTTLDSGSTSIADPPTTMGSATTLDPGFGTATIEVSGTALTVWVADTPSKRAQGLRGVEALPHGVDGMLFVFETPTSAVFGMKDTLIPLDIWWFGPQGDLLGVTEMRTCPDGGCVSYGSPGAVGWALETLAGAHDFPPEADLTTSANE